MEELEKRKSIAELKYSMKRIEFEEMTYRRLHHAEMKRHNLKFNSEKIHDLLMTNDEIDEDKVLCLHLLSIRQTDNDSFCKKSSSKKRLTRYSDVFPSYLVEDSAKVKCSCWDKSEKKPAYVHLSVNLEIEKIIYTIVTTLMELNVEKLTKLHFMAHDVKILQDLLTKPTCQEFLKALLKSDLVRSGKRFTSPCIIIKATNGSVDKYSASPRKIIFCLSLPPGHLLVHSLLTDKNSSVSFVEGKTIANSFERSKNVPDSFKDTIEFLLSSVNKEESKKVKTEVTNKKIDAWEKIAKKHLGGKTLKEKEKEPASFEQIKLKILSIISNQQKIMLSKEISTKKDEDFIIKLSRIMSKPDLLNLTKQFDEEERYMILKSIKRGGLGLGELLLGSKNMEIIEELACLPKEDLSMSTINYLINKSEPEAFEFHFKNSLDRAKIMHEIKETEIRKKISTFLERKLLNKK